MPHRHRLTVQEVMRVHVPTLHPNSTLRDAVDKMDLYQVSALAVLDADRRVCGVVSRGDVLRRLASDPGLPLEVGVTRRSADPVSEWMTTSVLTVPATEDAVVVAERMLKEGIRFCPVVMEERMVGTVSITDIIQGLLSRL